MNRQHTPPELAQAIQLHQSGQSAQAAQRYRQFLRQHPHHPDALRLLGTLLLDTGKLGDAAKFLSKAAKLSPGQAEILSPLGMALMGKKRLNEAEKAFRSALSIAPDDPQILSQLATLLHQMERDSEAIEAVQQALKLLPGHPALNCALGIFLRAEGRLNEALDAYDQALSTDPNLVEAHFNRGNVLEQLNLFQQAVDAYQQALRLNPKLASLHDNLGNVLLMTGQYAAAVAAYQDALKLKPNDAKILCNLANALKRADHIPQAIEIYQQVLDAGHRYALLYNGMANALVADKQLAKSIDYFQRALKLDPTLNDTRAQMILQLQQLGRWQDLPRLEQELHQRIEQDDSKMGPFVLLATSANARQQWQCANRYAATVFPGIAPGQGPFVHTRQQKPRITLGYLSSDFRRHPVGMLIQQLIHDHDRDRFEVRAYSSGKDDGSDIRAYIEAGADHFTHTVGMSKDQLAQQIYDDGVDILIDLNGHTSGGHLDMLVWRPAPLQVSFLGYAGTTGTDFIDYVVADRHVLPATLAPCFTEQPLRLPDSFMPNHRLHPQPAPPRPRSHYGLPESGVVFCNFNQTYKITSEVFAVWMKILHARPDSVLWLNQPNPEMTENLRHQAQRHGIAPERLIFAQHTERLEDHLARYRVADLFLDTRPYNAHATCSDALWSGCPLLTCIGDTFSSRVAGSLLHATGLGELVTDNLADYRTLALALASDPQRLSALRQRLDDPNLPLFDNQRYARHLEAGLTTIWQRYLAGQPARPIHVDTLPT